MKTSDSLFEEQFLKSPSKLEDFGGDPGMQNLPQLIYVTELESLKVKLTNFYANRFSTENIKSIQKQGECFYQKIVHPEDYPDFISHLRSLFYLLEGEEKEIVVRVKNRSGIWKKFLFKHRLYTGDNSKGSKTVIGTAKEIRPGKQLYRKSFSLPETENDLKRSREKYQTLLDGITNGFCIVELLFDLKTRAADLMFLETNPVFKKQVNHPHPEGKTMLEITPAHEKRWLKKYENVALTNRPERFQQYSADKGPIWYEVHAFPMGEEESRTVGILLNEITKRKSIEEKLRKTNEFLEKKMNQRTKELDEKSRLLQSVFDSTHEGIMILKPIYNRNGDLEDFLYLRVNKMVAEQYCREMVGRRYLEINPDAEDICVLDAFKRTMYSGIPEDFELKYDRKGYNNWFRITTRRQDELLITSLEDITRRKFASQRLKENIRFKKQIAETSPDIIMILDLYREKVRYINRDIATHPGMRKNEIDGMPIADAISFIHPHDREKALNFHSELMSAVDRDILDVEFRIRTREKKWEWFNARGKIFMRNRKGNVYEYILLLRNIEQQKRTQQALLQAEKLSIKGEVALTLAHELRNPMASIGMAADILSKKLEKKEDEQTKNYLKIIKRSTGILNRLLTDLLSSSNYSPLAPEKCCLADTLEAALRSAEDRIYLVGIRVLRAYSGNFYILADPEKLKIVLLNIIINASEAMNQNEGILKLSIRKEKSEFKLTIKDNGCGMKKEQLEKLFDAFYTQKPHGVGIGLSSVKSILEAHDATVLVESEPDKGTCFHLSFHCYETLERS